MGLKPQRRPEKRVASLSPVIFSGVATRFLPRRRCGLVAWEGAGRALGPTALLRPFERRGGGATEKGEGRR